ncbi:MAG: hypothetical protein ACTSR8_05080 [Promethearchaeota archaeon]
MFSVYGFLSTDSYLWFYDVMYLRTKGNLDYYEIQGYSAGFILFSGGSSLILNDFTLTFIYFKFILYFFFLINILAIFYISKRVFQKSVYILLTLLIFLSFKQFLERSIIPIPSVIANTIGFIFVLTYEWEDDIKTLIIRGMLLGGVILCHPLTGFYYVFFYFIYQLLILFMKLKGNSFETFEGKKNIYIIKKVLKSNLLLFLTLIGAILPFLINQFIKNPFRGGVLSNYLHFFDLFLFNPYTYQSYTLILYQDLIDFFIFWIIRGGRNFFHDAQDIIFLGQFFTFYNQIISYGIIFLVLGVILKYTKSEKTKRINFYENHLMIFIRITFIGAIFYFIILGFFEVLPITSLDSIFSFLDHYKTRILEPFEGLWALLFTRAIIILKKPAKKIYVSLLRFKKTTKDLINYKFSQREIAVFYIIIISIGAYFHFTNYLRISYINQYDDDHIEVVWFMNEYFDDLPSDIEIDILFSEVNPTVIFRIFRFRDNLDMYRIEMNKTTSYNDLNITQNKIDHIMVEKSLISNELMKNITHNFNKLYENKGYFFGIKS